MSEGLDVFIVDDDANTAEIMLCTVQQFYQWGDVIAFSDTDRAIAHCLEREIGVGIFITDVYLERKTGFQFLESVLPRFPSVYEDAIVITGDASDEVVNRCIEYNVTYLLEKPIRPYALQLAVRAIVMKYLKFAKRIINDPAFAGDVARF